MLRWIAVLFAALIVLSLAAPFLARYGLGRLPGDLRLKLFGRVIFVPLASTVLLSLLLTAISRLI